MPLFYFAIFAFFSSSSLRTLADDNGTLELKTFLSEKTVNKVADRQFFVYLLTAASKLANFTTEQHFNLGQKFKFLCYLPSGSSHHNHNDDDHNNLIFSWSKNGLSLTTSSSNNHLKITTFEDESRLAIDRLRADDAGNYSCSVKSGNYAHQHQQSTVLHVNGLYNPEKTQFFPKH